MHKFVTLTSGILVIFYNGEENTDPSALICGLYKCGSTLLDSIVEDIGKYIGIRFISIPNEMFMQGVI